MWGTISKAIPWEFIFGLFSKAVLYFIGKNEDKKEAKKAFLIFLEEVKLDAPVKLNKSYRDQIAVIKEELRKEEINNSIEKEKAKNYKEAYENLAKAGKNGHDVEILDNSEGRRV